MRLFSLGKNELDFPLREEEWLYSLYVRESDAFHEVVRDVAPRSCRGPHALECDANIPGSLRAHSRTRNKLLNHLGIEVLHRVLAKKRNKVLPNVSPVVDCRRIPELTQHFFFPVLSEVSELGRWPWPIADFVDVSDSVVQRPLSKSFRWIALKRSNRLFAPDT